MAKRISIYFIKQFIFWMLYFVIGRAIFILANTHEIGDHGIGEVLLAFVYALHLDVSAASYLLAIPFVFTFFQTFFRFRLFVYMNTWYSFIAIFLVSVITAGELGIYKEWGTKLSQKAVSYLKNPDEVMRTAQTGVMIGGLVLIIIQTAIGIFAYQKWVHIKKITEKRNWIFSIAFLILTPGLLMLGIRGGIQEITIRQSDAYYSKSYFLNQAAVNSPWNLMHSMFNHKKYGNTNPYIYYDLADAKKIVDDLHRVEKDTTVYIFKTDTPNIVLVLLESWAADVIPSCGGDSGVTPRFDKLVSEGLMFTNIYGTAARSEQGIVAIYSGYPSQPMVSIIENPAKGIHLPCIIDEFKQLGYFFSFHFGGQLNYGNIKGYFVDNEFDFLFEQKDFPSGVTQGKLGVHDEFMYAQFLSDLNNFKQPFFSTVFTLSSHSPYDQPMPEVLHWGDLEKDYINSVYYADSCLGVFMEKAKKQPWYKNTLFIFIADHSHSTPRATSFLSPEYKKIPMLFYGEVLKDEFKSYRYEKICSQVDLPKTLLAQLKLSKEKYYWSKDLFNPFTKEFAYYSFKDGVGWVIPNNQFAYHHQDNMYYIDRINDVEKRDSIIKQGKSYLQVMYEEYVSY